MIIPTQTSLTERFKCNKQFDTDWKIAPNGINYLYTHFILLALRSLTVLYVYCRFVCILNSIGIRQPGFYKFN
jgi:hypothetical protein